MNIALLVFLLIGQGPSPVPAPPAAEQPENQAEAEEARAVAKLLAGEYIFQFDKESGMELQREPEPVFRWLLQLDRRFYSDVYIWTHEGRPEVVAAITSVYGRRRAMETEIHSLSAGLPLLRHREKVVWQPERPGIKLMPIPNAPRPGSTAASRLRQMRTMAAYYAVSAEYGKMSTEELRLLPAPIYRYASESRRVTDGALFAFARGTDPEVFLMIEARKGEGGEVWQYALVRFVGHAALRAKRDGREIWQVDALPAKVNTDPKEPYFGLRKYSDFPVVK
ncbi:MAG: hypothetical protein KY475_03855 [Planctomycetes bacterium]|nr:hypothetical protein [Planctomycetota bacterium]